MYRDPTEIFREFFGGVDPFEEMAFGILGGRRHMSSNRVHRNRHRHTHNNAPQGRDSIHVHNVSASAAGSAGSAFRSGRNHRCRRERESQSRTSLSTLDPFSNIEGMWFFGCKLVVRKAIIRVKLN